MSLIERTKRWALIVSTVLAVAMPAAAQEGDTISDEAFLRGLSEMGLGDVVLEIAKNPPSDPMEAAGLRDALISAYLPTLKAQGGLPGFFQGVDMIIDYQKQLLNDDANKDYWARPVWMADFAQQMMFSALPEVQQAGDFALVGFPNANQRKIVDIVAETAYDQLRRADDEKFRLTAILRADPDFALKYINTGYWDQLKTYGDLNIPFYRAWSIVYLLTQPDDGSYFAAQKKAGVAPKNARAMLITQATVDLQTVLDKADALALADDTRARALMLRGHLAIEQGKYEQAVDALVKAGSFKDATAYTKLLVDLSRAKALQKSGKVKAMSDLLDSLRSNEAAKDNPLAQLLISDRVFFVHYDQALKLTDPEKQRPLLADAFAVYDRLLAGDVLGDWKDAIRGFIEERYKDQVPAGVPANKLPPTLRFAKIRGLVEQGERLNANGQAAEAKAAYEEAIATAKEFLESDDLSKAIRAETMYYMGFAQLRAGQAGYAAQTMINVGEQFPDTEWGERAISIAVVNLTKPLYQRSRDNDVVKTLYERSLIVLIDKYPTTELAKLSTYDLAAFYRETSEYAKAVEAYTKMPTDHPAYIAGQYEKVACLGALWADAPAGGAKVAQAEGLLPVIGDFERIAGAALRRATPDQREQIRQNIASAKLLKGSLLIESMKLPDEASKIVDEVESDYGNIASIKPRILRLRIRVFQIKGEYKKAEDALNKYMVTNPDQAGPLGLAVLTALIGQIEELSESKASQAEINKLADVAENLAEKIVLPWAEKQPDLDAEQKMAYDLIPAQAEKAAGRAQDALNRYNAIVRKYGKLASNNIDVLIGQAESYNMLKQYGSASRIFNRIIKHYQEQGIAKDSAFWHSYMRVMQMVDAQTTGKNPDIFLKIGNIERANPDLGGDPYASVLRELREKHRP
jgi:hypothetical protein